MISSTAEADRNHFSTGSLDAESVENVSRWSATGASVAGGYSGGESLANVAKSSAVAVGHVDHSETSTTQSVITGNIDVQSGSTTGAYSTDLAGANGHLDNDFNASSVNNTIQTQMAAETAGETAVELGVQAYEAANKASGFTGGGKKRTSGQTGLNTGQGGDATASSTASSLSGDQALTEAHHDAYPIDTADPTDPSQSGTRTEGQTATRHTQSNGDEAITVTAHLDHPYQPSAGLNFAQGMSDAEFAQWFLPPVAEAMSMYNTGKDIRNGDYKGAAWESVTGWGLGLETGAAGKVAGKVVALGLKEIQAATKAAREEKAAESVLNNIAHDGETTGGSGGSSGASAASKNTPQLDQDSIPGRVRSRINLANKDTRFTPVNGKGKTVDAGWEHVVERHFNQGNTQSQFTITQSETRDLLQSKAVVDSPIVKVLMIGNDPTYVRVADTGRVVGTVRKADGGGLTTKVRIQTDRAGNLITAYPVP
ncbi:MULTISPECIES: hypothetical protein [unclassified Asaia]|uniref:hypothetical protein n=1 Tax=unclassified Asaia TaxID=2685023 RepID=UPI000F8E5B54|nr:hypothetical protein [Asaia sp. W19]